MYLQNIAFELPVTKDERNMTLIKFQNKLFKMAQLSLITLLSFLPNIAIANDIQPLTQHEIKEVIAATSKQMMAEYISAEYAEKMSILLNKKYSSGAYNHFSDPVAFSDQITTDLRSINQDEHVRVSFEPNKIAAQDRSNIVSTELAATSRELRSMQRNNYGFKEVSILPGNVGYINLSDFHDPKYAAETAVAAMNYAANTDAIIFDLRKNGGGREQMMQFIASYLFDNEPVLLNNMYKRSEDKFYQTWTLPYVEGIRRPDVEVYILTSDYTFSAAEAFSYSLKHLKRATLVGETTGGGAHGGSPAVISNRFTLWLPRFEIINPITQTDWEGVGVVPHISVNEAAAFDTAYILALEKLIKKRPEEAYLNQWHLESVKAKTTPVTLSNETLSSYIGQYDKKRTLSFLDGNLFYQSGNGAKRLLTPLTESLFQVEGVDYFRIQIIENAGGVQAINGLYDDGRSIKYQKIST